VGGVNISENVSMKTYVVVFVSLSLLYAGCLGNSDDIVGTNDVAPVFNDTLENISIIANVEGENLCCLISFYVHSAHKPYFDMKFYAGYGNDSPYDQTQMDMLFNSELGKSYSGWQVDGMSSLTEVFLQIGNQTIIDTFEQNLNQRERHMWGYPVRDLEPGTWHLLLTLPGCEYGEISVSITSQEGMIEPLSIDSSNDAMCFVERDFSSRIATDVSIVEKFRVESELYINISKGFVGQWVLPKVIIPQSTSMVLMSAGYQAPNGTGDNITFLAAQGIILWSDKDPKDFEDVDIIGGPPGLWRFYIEHYD